MAKPGDITDVPLLNIARNPSKLCVKSLVSWFWLSLITTSVIILPERINFEIKIDAAKFYVNGENLKLWAKEEWIRKLIIMELLKIDSHLPELFH
jgi:hypothetical protein